jgi:hypothetical protein
MESARCWRNELLLPPSRCFEARHAPRSVLTHKTNVSAVLSDVRFVPGNRHQEPPDERRFRAINSHGLAIESHLRRRSRARAFVLFAQLVRSVEQGVLLLSGRHSPQETTLRTDN